MEPGNAEGKLRVERIAKYSGVALVVVPWILFLLCYLLNPQWILTRDALSSFGDPSFSKFPWVYNDGLGVIAVIIWVMSLGIVATSAKKMQVFGGAFWFVAGLFLALIGIYHGGTYPHDFVSTYFFVQAALAILVMGIGSFTAMDFTGAVIPVILAIIMPLGDILIPFPSSATTEIYEILIIDAWAIFSLFRSSGAVQLPNVAQAHFMEPPLRTKTIAFGLLVMVFVVLLGLIIFSGL
ncbi:MAG: DUF998 domain-containing protein [Nitrososphaerota archaeon]|nr:DUF998 domain-containing protein [Nitrososphaerota archaeon]